MVGVTGSIPVAPTILTTDLLLFSRVFKSSICLSAPEQTAHSAQKPGEFGQWLGKVFLQGSLVASCHPDPASFGKFVTQPRWPTRWPVATRLAFGTSALRSLLN